ncbi:MAG: cytochrome d ubiquinol oxidase subunit II [Flavobacteriaceae bacterium]
MAFDLPTVWAALIAFAVLMYVVLDGFDLGIGILFPFVRHEKRRDVMINSIAPVWDGNETWLVLGGGGLYAVFPLAYSLLLTAFYAPLTAMLLALIFRGVAFEFRFKDPRHRRWWDWGFSGGSILAAFTQGVVLGTFIQGVAVDGRSYAGGWFDWLTPFSLFTGIALVAGYGLLGATWLVMKAEGGLQAQCRRLAVGFLAAVLVALAVVSLWTPLIHEGVRGRWFVWPNIAFLAPVPLLGAASAFGLFAAVRKGADYWPFLFALALFVFSYLGLAISFYPYIVPPSVTVHQAAGPDESLGFLLVGALILLPLILAYTAYSYWVFRGKVRAGESYH